MDCVEVCRHTLRNFAHWIELFRKGQYPNEYNLFNMALYNSSTC